MQRLSEYGRMSMSSGAVLAAVAVLVLFLMAGCSGGGGGGGAVANQPPVANAGSNQSVEKSVTVTLAGSGTDPDGTIASYQCQQVGGGLVTLSNANTATTSFTASTADTRTFRLTVTDNAGASGSATVVVTATQTFLSENFSSMNNWTTVDDTGAASSWTALNGALNQGANVENGPVAFTNSYHLGTYAFYTPGISSADYRFSVDATYLSSATGHADDIGVMFRYTDNDRYYRLSLNSRYGFTRLEKKIGTLNFIPLATNTRGYSAVGQLLKITVDVKGSVIEVFLNGDPLFAVNDISLPSGTVALYTQNNAKFANVLVQNAGTAPAVVLASPLAYSVSTTQAISASALASNLPTGGYVEFLLDGANSIVASAAPYTATFAGVASGDHTVTAILRDSGGVELARDTNVKVGVQGNKLLAVGDSITNGDADNYAADNNSADERIIAFQGYAASLSDMLSSALPNVVVNEGIRGDLSGTSLPRIDSILARSSDASKVLLMLGTNDALQSIGAGTYQTNMQAIVAKAAGKEVWVARVPPVFGNLGSPPFANPDNEAVNTTYVKPYNTFISNWSINHGPDFYGYFLGNGTNRLSLIADNVHPNALGHAVMAGLWRNALLNTPIPLPFVLDNLIPSTSTSPPYLKQNLLQVGNKYYVDQTYTLTSIPPALANGRWVMTANADVGNTSVNNYISFSVDRSVTVYVAYASGANLPSWLSSNFTDTGLTLSVTNPPNFKLYSRSYGIGAVTLGGNQASPGTGASHYLAIVVAN